MLGEIGVCVIAVIIIILVYYYAIVYLGHCFKSVVSRIIGHDDTNNCDEAYAHASDMQLRSTPTIASIHNNTDDNFITTMGMDRPIDIVHGNMLSLHIHPHDMIQSNYLNEGDTLDVSVARSSVVSNHVVLEPIVFWRNTAYTLHHVNKYTHRHIRYRARRIA